VWEMLGRIKAERNLTVLMTTHYMDEADQLCDRIAIVDHGKLVALDSPISLKAAISGRSAVEASFTGAPPDWRARLEALPGVDGVTGEGSSFRLSSSSGPATTSALLEVAERAGVLVRALAVRSTTLDDVFVHFTGRDLRDALQEPSMQDRRVMFRRP
jgi:ABC-2 type transport system ATP-binding protein